MKRVCAALAAVIFVLAVSTVQGQAAVAWGSRGDDVYRVQARLRQYGYYSGTLDGIFGQATYDAVTWFQRRNSLTPDGVVGPATAAALGVSLGGSAQDAAAPATESESYLLARLVHGEARGEPYVGQVAVGAVVLNRVEHPSFPNSISGVIYQPGAFSCLDDGQFNQPIAESAYRAAQEALDGSDPSGGAIYYFNPVTATSAWIWSRPLIVQIGRHRFCS